MLLNKLKKKSGGQKQYLIRKVQGVKNQIINPLTTILI